MEKESDKQEPRTVNVTAKHYILAAVMVGCILYTGIDIIWNLFH